MGCNYSCFQTTENLDGAKKWLWRAYVNKKILKVIFGFHNSGKIKYWPTLDKIISKQAKCSDMLNSG